MGTKRTTLRGFLDAGDGIRLYYESDEVADARAALLLVHGFFEHSGRYQSVVDRLTEAGYSCYRFDVRGHGQSGGTRGHVFRFQEYLDDLALCRAQLFEANPDRPRFLLGHSNGGLIGLHAASLQPEGWAGLALSSPFVGFGLKVPRLKALAGKALSGLLPSLTLAAEIHPEWVSHDPAVVETYRTDPLNHQVASSRWFTETLAAHALAPSRAAALQLPTLVQQAGDDRIASAPATRAIFEQIGSDDKTYEEYPGLFHEIWFELERERPLADLERWLEGRLG